MCAIMHLWRSEDNLQKLILSYCMDSGTQTQVLRLGGKFLYLLSHLAGFFGVSIVSCSSPLTPDLPVSACHVMRLSAFTTSLSLPFGILIFRQQKKLNKAR